MRDLKNFDTATDFVAGFLAFYNYLRPHESLENRTPANAAGIDYPYQNWGDIISKHKPSKPVIIEHQPRAMTAMLKEMHRVRLKRVPNRVLPGLTSSKDKMMGRRL
jgi:hypothetical protein